MLRHVGIIMDGNGRWAELRGQSRLMGHAQGAVVVRDIVSAAAKQNLEALTLYAFSSQNWGRPSEEVDHLMRLLSEYLYEERAKILKNGIRFCAIGELERLPQSVQDQLEDLRQLSKDNSGMYLTLALSYGGREEILFAVKKLVTEAIQGNLNPEEVTEKRFQDALWSGFLPPMDLLIRTSGELRISNFMLWHAAYAEIIPLDVLWPDFTPTNLFECIETFEKRERRFGLTKNGQSQR